jgi:hypothetical protein
VDVDAGAEGDVDCGVEICREEDNALKIFELSEEDWEGVNVERREE